MRTRERQATRALIVARRSRKSEKSISIEDQVELCRGRIAAEGWTEVGPVIDNAVSGDKPPTERPGLGPYLTDDDKVATYDALLAYDQDRYGRSTLHWILTRAWAQEHDKAVFTITEGDKDLRGDVFMGNVKASFAEEELRKIRERCRRDKAARRRENIPSGKVVWPFETVGGTVRVKDGPYLRVLLSLIDLAEHGATLTDCARYLDSEAASDERLLPRMGGAEWNPKSVGNILRSTSLYGVQTSEDGKRRVLTFAPVITYERWQALQERLDLTTAIRRRGPKRRESGMLLGVAKCGECGGNLHYREIKGRVRKDGTRPASNWYLRCDGHGKDGSTCGVMLRVDDVEDDVEWRFRHSKFYMEQTPDIDHREAFLRDPNFEDDILIDPYFGALPMVEVTTIAGTGHADDIAKIDARMNALDKDADDYDEQHAALSRERKALRADEKTSLPKTVTRETGQTLGEYWATLSKSERRAHLLATGLTINAYSDGTLFYEGDPTRIVSAAKTTKKSHLTLAV